MFATTKLNSIRILCTFVIALAVSSLTQPKAMAATFHYLHGLKDNFVLPIDPATPDIGMTTLYASFVPYQNYDEPGTTDRIFIDLTCYKRVI